MDRLLLTKAILVLVFTGAAVATDLRGLRIPNWLTVSGLVGGLGFHGLTQGWGGLWFALGGFGVGFGLLLVLWLIGGAGGGDVKLMGAVGAWLGAPLTVIVFLLSTVFALLLLAIMVTYQAMMRGRSVGTSVSTTTDNGGSLVHASRRKIPYALPVALSTWSLLIVKLVAN